MAEDTGVAVVTGAGSGIGRAVAIRLARSGYVCVLVGRRESPLTVTAELIAGVPGARPAVVAPADVSAEAGRDVVMSVVDGQDRPLAALVNNAGDMYAAALYAQDLQAWRAEFALNVEAMAFLSFAAMRRMSGAGGGGIVNIASVYGSIALNRSFYGNSYPADTEAGPVRPASYTASKGAVRALSKDLAVAGAEMQVRVNTVSPGAIAVESHGKSAAELERLGSLCPMGKVGRPEDVAGAVNFLLSAEAGFITGAEIVVDGGWTSW